MKVGAIVYPFLLLMLASLPLASAEVQPLDLQRSRFAVVFTQMSVPVEAAFTRVDAQVEYDPMNPESGKAELEVDVDSFDLGDPAYNREVLKPEWFDAASHPTARFVTERIEPLGDDRLLAHGTLTVKGRSKRVSVPMSVAAAGGGWVFEGEFPISRLAFGIGADEWADTDLVADEVLIRFRAVTQKSPTS